MYNSPNSSSIFLNIELCTMFFSEANILKHVFFLNFEMLSYKVLFGRKKHFKVYNYVTNKTLVANCRYILILFSDIIFAHMYIHTHTHTHTLHKHICSHTNTQHGCTPIHIFTNITKFTQICPNPKPFSPSPKQQITYNQRNAPLTQKTAVW